jgi:hypothetical protein
MTPLELFILPAKARAGWWRFATGILLIAAVWVLGSILAVVVVAFLDLQVAGIGDADALETSLDAMEDADGPVAVMALLASFFGVWIGVWIVGRLLSKQPFGTFFSPDRRIHIGLFLKAAAFGGSIALVFSAIELLISEDVRTGLDFDQWAVILAPLIALTFVQATAEELFFRGYLLQQLAVRSMHWLVWAALPSFLFGVGHFSPDLPDGGGYYYVALTFLTGLVFCAMVWRSGSLWPAIGLHVSVNVVSMTVLGIDGIVSGTQLWVTSETDIAPIMQIDLVMVALMLVFVLSPMGRIFEPERTGVAQEASASSQ